MADAGFKPQKEINRLKTLIRRLERDKDKMYPELGRLTYGEYLEGRLSEEALGEYCERLKAIDAQVGEANAQIAGLQAQVQQMKAGPPLPAAAAACPSCGAAVTPGLKFCGNCGAGMASGAPAPVGALSCPSCGKPVAAGTRFCGECGQPMPAVPPPAPPPPAAPVPTPAPPPPPPVREPVAYEAAPGEPVKCPACGAAVEEEGAAFCGECGARIA